MAAALGGSVEGLSVVSPLPTALASAGVSSGAVPVHAVSMVPSLGTGATSIAVPSAGAFGPATGHPLVVGPTKRPKHSAAKAPNPLGTIWNPLAWCLIRADVLQMVKLFLADTKKEPKTTMVIMLPKLLSWASSWKALMCSWITLRKHKGAHGKLYETNMVRMGLCYESTDVLMESPEKELWCHARRCESTEVLMLNATTM